MFRVEFNTKDGENHSHTVPMRDHAETVEYLRRNYSGHFMSGPEMTGEPTIEEIENDFLQDLTYEECYRAKYNTSLTPEHRAYLICREWIETTEKDREQIKKIAGEKWEDEFKRFHEKSLNLFKNWLYRQSQCLSPMITGPARFPSSRAQKASNSEAKAREEWLNFRERALKAIEKAAKPEVNELEEARRKLASEQKTLERMKEANKILRAKSTEAQKFEALQKIGLPDKTIRQLFTPDYMGQTGFKTFELTNCRNRIKNTEDRLKQLEAKEAHKTDGETVIFENETLRIIENPDVDRYQVIFKNKPDREMCAFMKSKGFKWAPSQNAWQNFRTLNGKWRVQQLIERIK